MNRTQRLLIAAVFVLLGFAVALATLNFKLARARTNSKTTFTEASKQQPGARRAIPTNRIFLHVEKREGLGGVLAWKMRRQLQEVCGFTVTLLNNDPGPEDFPLVLVAVRDDKLTWTPFYAGGSTAIFAKFASNTSHITVESAAALFAEDDAESDIIPLVVSLNANVENSTMGIVSLPAFRDIVLHDITHGFAEHLKKSIESAEAKAAEAR